MAHTQSKHTDPGVVTSFFRLSNRHISASLRRFSEHADSGQQYGFSSLGDLALYAMIGTVLSNPSFTYAHGGLQNLLLRHTRNRYFSLHNSFRRLTRAGYLHRTRIPEGKNCFHDYYTLSHSITPSDIGKDSDRCLSHAEGASFRASYQPFLPPTEDYTEVSIPMLMDPTLSLGAKGLYIVIARYLRLTMYKPELVLSKDMLRAVCPEGSNAFDRMFRELRCRGYLSLTREKNPKTGYPHYRYMLNKTPDIETGDVCHAQKQPIAQTAPAVSPILTSRKQTAPVDAASNPPTPSVIPVSEIRSQIEYSCLADDYPKERLDCIVSILHTYLSPPRQGDARQIPIAGVSYPREEITARFSALDSEDIRFVLDTYQQISQTKKIHSVRRYLTTCLFHAKENLALALDAFAVRTPGISAP